MALNAVAATATTAAVVATVAASDPTVDAATTDARRLMRQRTQLLAAGVLLAVLLAHALPSATAFNALCGTMLSEAPRGTDRALLWQYCKLTQLDAIAQAMALVGMSLSATTLALYLLMRDTNDLLNVAGGYMSLTSALAAVTFLFTSSRGKLHVVLPGARPFIVSDLSRCIRWLLLAPSYRAIGMEVSRLIHLHLSAREGREAEGVAALTADAVAGLTPVGSAAASNARAYLLDYSTWHPKQDWLVLSLAVLGTIAARLSSGGWHGGAPVLLSIALSVPYFAPHVLDPVSAARLRLQLRGLSLALPNRRPTISALVSNAAPPPVLPPPGGDATPAAAAAREQPDSPEARYYIDLQRYGTVLQLLSAASVVGAGVVIACELALALLPATPLGVRAAVVAESVQLCAEFTYFYLPIFRLYVLLHTWQERQLKEQQQHAQLLRESAATNSRRQYMRTVFHEVRTPLNSAGLALGELAGWRELPPPEVDRLLGMCTAAHATSATILNSVLSLASIEAGAFKLSLAPTALPDVAQRALWQLRPWADAAGVALELQQLLPRPAQLLLCDGPRLCQVLANLLSNALKACPHDGTGRVVVRLREAARPALAQRAQVKVAREGPAVSAVAAAAAAAAAGSTVCVVRLEVSDNGRGIDGAQQARLFRPFSQLEKPPPSLASLASGGRARPRGGRPRDGGASEGPAPDGGQAHGRDVAPLLPDDDPSTSGLGLAIAREIIERHGGTIGVVSEPGHGATFWCELPLQLAAGQGAAVGGAIAGAAAATAAADGGSGALATRPAAAPPSSSAAHPWRFLVVDDSTSNRKLIVRIVQRRWPAAVVDEAADGAAAVEAVRLSRAPPPPAQPPGAAAATTAAPAAGRHGGPPYAALILDAQMPVMSGYDAAARIRASEVGSSPLLHLPIIGCTGNALEEDVRAFAAAGCDAVVTKPFTAAELFASLEPWLQLPTTAAAAAPAAGAPTECAAAGDSAGEAEPAPPARVSTVAASELRARTRPAGGPGRPPRALSGAPTGREL